MPSGGVNQAPAQQFVTWARERAKQAADQHIEAQRKMLNSTDAKHGNVVSVDVAEEYSHASASASYFTHLVHRIEQVAKAGYFRESNIRGYLAHVLWEIMDTNCQALQRMQEEAFLQRVMLIPPTAGGLLDAYEECLATATAMGVRK